MQRIANTFIGWDGHKFTVVYEAYKTSGFLDQKYFTTTHIVGEVKEVSKQEAAVMIDDAEKKLN